MKDSEIEREVNREGLASECKSEDYCPNRLNIV